MYRHPTTEQRKRHRNRTLVIGDDFSFRPGKDLATVEVLDEAETMDCGVEPPALAYTAPGFISFPPSSFRVANMEVLAVEAIAGNCFGVTVQRGAEPAGPSDPAADGGAAGAAGAPGGGAAGAPGGGGANGEEMSVLAEPAHLSLCAPIALFPFRTGDVVEIDGTNGEDSGSLTVRTQDRRFTIRIGEQAGFQFRLEAGGCGPVRGEDGAPWLTVPVVRGGAQSLVPGEVQSFEDAGGILDVYLGRSRRVFGCVENPGKVSVEIVERWSL